MSDGSGGQGADDPPENVPDRFDRLPGTAADREVPGRPTRPEVLGYFEDRFGIPPDSFADHTLWERGKGKIWALAGSEPTPADVEALGLTLLRTRGEYWKPTMAGIGRFGDRATRNVLQLDPEKAGRFLAGEDQEVDWDGDWGYLIVAHELAGEPEPLGVGLFTYGTLRSQVPKGRRREFGRRDDG
jgi:NOL1/NOP2/fmu family ribosome biogenesis protein